MPRGQAQVDEEARAFRPNRTPVIVAVVLNLAVAIAFLGFPYVRGRVRAEDAQERFARFAVCLWGGRAAGEPGLGLPEGDRERFATRMRDGGRDWPARCRDELERVAPDTAWLVLPSVKRAEEDVRRATTAAIAGLLSLADARARFDGTIPVDPLSAIERLRAALSEQARAAGVERGIEEPAIVFDRGASRIVTPTRVPLQAMIPAELRLSAHRGGLDVVAFDRRGVSRVRVGAGRVDLRRIRRPSLVQGIAIDEAGEPWLVWATPEARCAASEDRCARRSMGLATYPREETIAPEPRWIGAHPAGAIGSSVHVDRSGNAVVLARAEGGGLELRWIGPPAEGTGTADAPAAPVRRVALGSSESHGPAMLADRGRRALWVVESEAGVVPSQIEPGEPGAVVRQKTWLPVEGARPWLDVCADAGNLWIAVGTDRRARLEHEIGGELEGAAVAIAPRGGTLEGRVRCSGRTAVLAVLTGEHALLVARCAADRCTEPAVVARGVGAFDLALDRGTALVAWTSRANRGGVYVASIGDDGRPLARSLPSACWSDGTGLCGAPVLAAERGRFVVAAREGGDLLAIETRDGGRTWRPMSGLR